MKRLIERHAPKIVRFIFVGGIGTVVNMGSLAVFYHVVGLPLSISSAFAIELAIVSNFIGHSFLTFGTRGHHIGRRFVSFQLISLVAATVAWLTLNGLAHWFGTDPVWIVYAWNAIAIAIGFSFNYVLNSATTWRDAFEPPEESV